MTIEVGNKGGLFRSQVFIHDQTITTGQTGDLVTIGTAGKITELSFIGTDSAGTSQAGIDLVVDGVAMNLLGDLADQNPSPDSWFVGGGVPSRLSANGMLTNVIGEFIKITKTPGNTAIDIKYSYATGVVK